MPKMKTHKGTAKRVKLTGSGKILRRRAFGGHMLAKKSNRRKRVIGSPAEITGKLAKNVKQALGVK
ncbi:MAG: 50S ribosomal protein L35 [Candidatus Saccharimonadales bacterium]